MSMSDWEFIPEPVCPDNTKNNPTWVDLINRPDTTRSRTEHPAWMPMSIARSRPKPFYGRVEGYLFHYRAVPKL